MKKIILFTTALLALSPSSFALDMEDFDAEDEGRLAAKFRVFGAFPKSKQSDLPTPTPALDEATKLPGAPKDNEDLVNVGGGGIELATEVFLTDHVATELAIGIGVYNTNKLTNVAYNYVGSSGHADAQDPKFLWFAPISFGVKYFVAPFGAISPYFGLTYSYNIFVTMSSEYNVGNAHSLVFQGGIDFVTRDDTVYSIDIKKYLQRPEVRYNESLIAKQGGKEEVKANLKEFDPIMVSVGVGYKF
jgi:outer membrane protein W